ncbi:polysaccharide biosynthesis tyrosine autokinase [Croceicoccus sp. BE223]|uniref:GumC family protein n=1 Tax=Croceicoccus sp. BE223 TaxID=2817716 RepID=UPI00286CD7DC|nr:polysaccharide biosynthesis tyrosine autokinase [Croceicoccus sp. BE223]
MNATVRYILSRIRHNLLSILLIIALALAAAVVVTMLATPRYTATATVQINDQSENVLGEDLGADSNSNVGWDVERFLNTQLEVLRSRDVAERVANSLKLYDDPAFIAAMELPAESAAGPVEARRQMVVGLLQSNLGTDLPHETRVVRISFNSANPEVSARIANAFAEQFIQSTLQRRYDSSSYARTFIADQLQEARTRLERSERELNAYARRAGLIRSRDGSNGEDGPATGSSSVTTASLSQINEAANRLSAERIAAEARWQAEAAMPALSSPTVLANPTVQQLMTDRARVDAKLETLRARYLDDYPEIVQLQAERKSINEQIASVAQSVRNSVRSQYVSALEAEQALRSKVDGLKGDTLAEQDRTVRYNTLAREADTNRSIYDGLLQRYRELNASAGISSSNLSIIDRAEVPGGPSSPNLLKNLLIAFVIGVFLAGVFVFVRDLLDDAIRVPEDVEQKMNMALLGVIPVASADNPDDDLADPKSPMSEAYNSLRGQLLYSTSEGLPKIIQVTSARQSEGKTTSSNAIAAGLARMGKRVVLVDADLRRPSEHKRHRLANQHGLSGLLTGADTLTADTLHEIAPNLDVITSGPVPPSPTELLSSPRMAHLLEELARRYDCVVLDSPPVLGLADAPVLSALSDGVVFVVESAGSRTGVLRTALRRLRAMNPVILGAVLTKFDPSHSANTYSEYYGYEYYRYASPDHAGG